MCPGIWVGAASGRIYQSWCLTENWACVKGVKNCTCCPPHTSSHLCLHLLHLLFLSVWQPLLSPPMKEQLVLSWLQPAQSPDTTLLVVPCPQQQCWRRDRGVLKGHGSICISLYCFPNVWVLIPSVARNSFPLNGFYYAIHVWGGFLKAISQNSPWLHQKPVSCLLVVLAPPSDGSHSFHDCGRTFDR